MKSQQNWHLIIIFIVSDEANFARNLPEKFPTPDFEFFLGYRLRFVRLLRLQGLGVNLT